ncbi:hypothetical protein E4N62_46735 [Streptomyces sp. MNU76]|uniref:hypothetical protein n=1 Tax=Streptomyces sp. MNU76 TaxID=2560026 RepID=UPI001E3E32F5|nr:hypothetical protein [Streptomyces sp. MNU76]MCC9712054.1 hypothetical protein [Streptomyces sp. MNU76]
MLQADAGDALGADVKLFADLVVGGAARSMAAMAASTSAASGPGGGLRGRGQGMFRARRVAAMVAWPTPRRAWISR